MATALSSCGTAQHSLRPVISTSSRSKLRSDCGRRATPSGQPWRVLDAGCGTGFHLAHLAAAFDSRTTGLGLDISAAAARLAARRWLDMAFAVFDLWTDWPVTTSQSTSSSASLRRGILPRRRGCSDREAGSPWSTRVPIIPPNWRSRYGLLDQREGKARHYAEAAADRAIGPSTLRAWCVERFSTPMPFAMPY